MPCAARRPSPATPMRSADFRRLRASRPHAEPARPGAAALLIARGTVRRSARAISSPVVAPNAGLAARSGLCLQPSPVRRETRLRG